MDVKGRKVLGHAAKLHDIGKVAISDSVISKPSRLTRAEYLMVQQHTILGYQLLQPMKIDPVITGAILSHHENYDGSGYPEGLKGEAIPLAARLIRIADFYDALTSRRSYRNGPALSTAEALDVLQENRRCFDPSLFSAFVEMIMEKS
jgi:HD-GYP domain-containing protein (c-di-GMP phosphodiesterase class II)